MSSLLRKLFNSCIAMHSTNNSYVNWTNNWFGFARRINTNGKKRMRETIRKTSIVRFCARLVHTNVDFVCKKWYTNFDHIVPFCSWGFLLVLERVQGLEWMTRERERENHSSTYPKIANSLFLCGNNFVKWFSIADRWEIGTDLDIHSLYFGCIVTDSRINLKSQILSRNWHVFNCWKESHTHIQMFATWVEIFGQDRYQQKKMPMHSSIAFKCCHIRQPFNTKCHAFRGVFELKRKLNKTLHIFQLKWNELAKLLSWFFPADFLSTIFYLCMWFCNSTTKMLYIFKRRSSYLTSRIKSSSKKKFKSINRIF